MTDEPIEIHMLIVLCGQESLLTTIRAEQMNYKHPWQLPNITIQKNHSNQELLLLGNIGINQELFHADVPTFHVHQSKIGKLTKEFKNATKKGNDTSKSECGTKSKMVNKFNSLKGKMIR